MIRKTTLILLAIGLLLGFTVPALADGMLVHPANVYPPLPGGKFIEPDQRCFIIDAGDGYEALALQVSFGKADLKEFGWLIPLPAVPEVKPVGQELFDALYGVTYRAPLYYGGGGGCGGGGNGVMPVPEPAKDTGGVDYLDRQVVGNYDVFTVAAETPDDLKTWIEDNGYVLPEGDAYKSVFQRYIDKDWIFVAIKVHLPDEIPWYDGYTGYDYSPIQYGVLHPLFFLFKSDELIYPMLISKLNGGATDLTMYVLASHKMRFKDSKQKWAGWVKEADFTDGSPLEFYVKGTQFMTKLRRVYFWDKDYDADLYLLQAADDKEDREAQAEIPTNFLMLGFLAFGFPIYGRLKKRKSN